MKVDSIKTIMRRFEHDYVSGLQVLFHYPPDELAREYGDPRSTRVYSTKSDLLSLYLAKRWMRTAARRTDGVDCGVH